MQQSVDMMRFAGGVSDESEVNEALDEALGSVEQSLDGRDVHLCVMFCSPHHTKAFSRIIERIQRQLEPEVLIGMTAVGVLGNGVEIERRAGLSVLAGHMPGVQLHPFCHEQLEWPDTEDDPQELRETVFPATEGEPAGMLLLADPFSSPMVKLVPALNEALGPAVPIVGGMASAGMNPGDNRLYINDRIHREGLVGLVLSGNVRMDCTVSQGCRPIGQSWVITKARHNLIQEVGGKNILQMIRSMADTIDDEDRALMENGLLLGRVIDEYKGQFGRGDFLIRNIIGADEDAGYIAIADLVRAGQTVQFHVRDARAAEEDLRLLLQKQDLQGPAAGAILCTCNGRGTNMFEQPNVESTIISQSLGHAPMTGFFAAGEIGPVGDENFLHGFTASLAVLRPKVHSQG